jgi:flavodoxin
MQSLVERSWPLIVLLVLALVCLALFLFSRRKEKAPNERSSSASAVSSPGDGPKVPSSALPRMLPVKILFSSTTGTARSYAKRMERELFAMHVSGFHFRVSVADLATYDVDQLEQETLLLVLLPTWTGGVAPPSAAPFVAHLADLATDFRVSKDALKHTRFAVFGLGSREYGRDWCRASRDVDAHFEALSARRLLPLRCGDDSADQDAAFQEWRDVLWPALCEVFAQEFGTADVLEQRAADDSCGACSNATSSSRVYRVAQTWEEEEEEALRRLGKGSDGLRQRGVVAGSKTPAASSGASASSCCGGAGPSGRCACQGDGELAPEMSATLSSRAWQPQRDRPFLAEDGSELTRRQWRKQRAAAREAEVAAAARRAAAPRKDAEDCGAGSVGSPVPAAHSSSVPSGEGSAARAGPVDSVAGDGASDADSAGDGEAGGAGFVDEEDAINDLLLREADGLEPDSDAESDAGGSTGGHVAAAGRPTAYSGGVDVEDLGAALAEAAAEKRAEAEGKVGSFAAW